MLFTWLIDFICRIALCAIGVGAVVLIVAFIILTIGEKRGWWD